MDEVIYMNAQMMVFRAQRIERTPARHDNCAHLNVVESPEKFVDNRARLRKCLVCQKVESSLFGVLFGVKGATVKKLSSSEFSTQLTPEQARFWKV